MRPAIKSFVNILAATFITLLLFYTAPFIFSLLKFISYYLFCIPRVIYKLSSYAVDFVGKAAALIFKGLGYILRCITEVGPSVLKALWEALKGLWSVLKAVARLVIGEKGGPGDEDHELR